MEKNGYGVAAGRKKQEKLGIRAVLGEKKFLKWVLGLFWGEKSGKNGFGGRSGGNK